MGVIRILSVLLLTLTGCHRDVVLSSDASTPPDAHDTAADLMADTPLLDLPLEPEARPDTSTEPDLTMGGVVGDACSVHADCGGVPGEGRMCAHELLGLCPFPGGYCTAVCTSDAECGADGACLDVIGLDSYCFKRCTSGEECRLHESHRCDRLLEHEYPTVCLPPSGCTPTPDG